MSANGFKIIFDGAVGALTLGIYFQYTTNKAIEENNKQMRFEMDKHIEHMHSEHSIHMNKIKNDIDNLKSFF